VKTSCQPIIRREMINLAGNKDADKHIEEELYLAHIPTDRGVSEWDVPYTIIGRLPSWTFERAWYYYSVVCHSGLGLPYDIAVKLHETKYPIRDKQYSILGQAIRVDGLCNCPHPKERRYPTLESIEEEFVEARKRFPNIDFNTKKAFNESTCVESKGVKYIRLYHIDTQVGLNEFARIVQTPRACKVILKEPHICMVCGGGIPAGVKTCKYPSPQSIMESTHYQYAHIDCIGIRAGELELEPLEEEEY